MDVRYLNDHEEQAALDSFNNSANTTVAEMNDQHKPSSQSGSSRIFEIVDKDQMGMGMMQETPGFDMETRDPNNLNLHLQVMWDDVIAEPEGIRSRDCTWRTSYKCFRGAKHCCYRFLACLLGPFLACCLGCQFACLSFQHIWCNTPCLRQCKINCNFVRAVNRICAQAVLAPGFEVCSLLCSKIRVRHGQLPAEDEKEVDIFTV